MTDNLRDISPPNDVSPPRDEDARLIYDDLRRFCDARQAEITSILHRSQFLLLVTASLYAAVFLAGRTAMGFLWQELAAGLVMIPSILLLLRGASPVKYRDNALDKHYLESSSKATWFAALSQMEDLANSLRSASKKVAKIHFVGYVSWCASFLTSLSLVTWAQVLKGV